MVVPAWGAVVRTKHGKHICIVTRASDAVITHLAVEHHEGVNVPFIGLSPADLRPGLQTTAEDFRLLRRWQPSHLGAKSHSGHSGSLELPEKKPFSRCQNQVPRGLPELTPVAGWPSLATNLNLSCDTEVFQDPGTQRCKKRQLNL